MNIDRCNPSYDDAAKIRTALELILDSIDYTSGACRVNEMVGAALPQELLERAKLALKRR